MSAYEILFTKRAVKEIEALDRVAKKQLAKKILELAEDPIKLSKKMVSSTIGTYRYRVGDYRIIFDLNGKKIIVLRVGHRREIYR